MVSKVVLMSAAAIGLLTASPAIACRPSLETYVFLTQLPRQIDDDAIVLRVRPQKSVTAWNNGLVVDVIDVVRGDWSSDTAYVDYGPFTSCSRAHLPAEGAWVIGRPVENTRNSLIAQQFKWREWENDDAY